MKRAAAKVEQDGVLGIWIGKKKRDSLCTTQLLKLTDPEDVQRVQGRSW